MKLKYSILGFKLTREYFEENGKRQIRKVAFYIMVRSLGHWKLSQMLVVCLLLFGFVFFLEYECVYRQFTKRCRILLTSQWVRVFVSNWWTNTVSFFKNGYAFLNFLWIKS